MPAHMYRPAIGCRIVVCAGTSPRYCRAGSIAQNVAAKRHAEWATTRRNAFPIRGIMLYHVEAPTRSRKATSNRGRGLSAGFHGFWLRSGERGSRTAVAVLASAILVVCHRADRVRCIYSVGAGRRRGNDAVRLIKASGLFCYECRRQSCCLVKMPRRSDPKKAAVGMRNRVVAPAAPPRTAL